MHHRKYFVTIFALNHVVLLCLLQLCGTSADLCSSVVLRSKVMCSRLYEPLWCQREYVPRGKSQDKMSRRIKSLCITILSYLPSSITLTITWESQKGKVKRNRLGHLKFCFKKKILIFGPWLYRCGIFLWVSPLYHVDPTFVRLFCFIS